MNREMQEAVDFLYDLPRFTKKNSLAHTRKLMGLLGDPCSDRKVIHVAGSNGKGSVCCFLYHMLLAGGAGAAMFTSPHLVDIRERFQINGALVGEEAFLAAYDRVAGAVRTLVEGGEPHPTFFEYVYAIAMLLFDEAQVDYIILETGLGGRLDATNTFPTPLLSVITPISLEHTAILGDTVEQIAAEKAGILKEGVPVVYAAGDAAAVDVIAARASALGCPATEVSFHIEKIERDAIDFSLSPAYDKKTVWQVSGHALYQAQNAALALETMRVLRRITAEGTDETGRQDGEAKKTCRMDDETLQQGLLAAEWPGRMQEVLPGIYFDGAHNPAGIAAFVASARLIAAKDPEPPLLLFAMVGDKDLETTAELLLSGMAWDAVAVTTVPGARGTDAAQTAASFAGALVYEDCRDAFFTMQKRKREGQKLFCTGSLYLIGALLEALLPAEGSGA